MPNRGMLTWEKQTGETLTGEMPTDEMPTAKMPNRGMLTGEMRTGKIKENWENHVTIQALRCFLLPKGGVPKERDMH